MARHPPVIPRRTATVERYRHAARDRPPAEAGGRGPGGGTSDCDRTRLARPAISYRTSKVASTRSAAATSASVTTWMMPLPKWAPVPSTWNSTSEAVPSGPHW